MTAELHRIWLSHRGMEVTTFTVRETPKCWLAVHPYAVRHRKREVGQVTRIGLNPRAGKTTGGQPAYTILTFDVQQGVDTLLAHIKADRDALERLLGIAARDNSTTLKREVPKRPSSNDSSRSDPVPLTVSR